MLNNSFQPQVSSASSHLTHTVRGYPTTTRFLLQCSGSEILWKLFFLLVWQTLCFTVIKKNVFFARHCRVGLFEFFISYETSVNVSLSSYSWIQSILTYLFPFLVYIPHCIRAHCKCIPVSYMTTLPIYSVVYRFFMSSTAYRF